MEIQIERAAAEDAQALIQVFNKSFLADFQKYGECPGYNKSTQDMLHSIQKRDMYKIMSGESIIGAIGVQKQPDGSLFLGALCVVPEHENQGIGQKAMRFIEQQYSGTKHWALETPSDKTRNHYFYKKFGYRKTKEYMDGSVNISWFEKDL